MKATKTKDLESARRRSWARPTPFRIERFGALWPLLILSISCQSPPDQRPIFVSPEAQRIHHCYASEHSGREALQLQRPESAGHFRAAPPSRMRLPIRSKWKLSTLDGPTTTESKRQSAGPEIEISIQTLSNQSTQKPEAPEGPTRLRAASTG
jgi:hypothetical protein